jgi:HK97 gp10 family phage protein
MSLTITGKLVGNEELLKQISQKLDAADKLVAQAVEKSAQLVEARAKEKCPVDEGNLRARITYQMIKNGREISARVGTNVWYSVYVEFGTGLFSTKGTGRSTGWVYHYDGKKGRVGFRFTRGQKAKPYLYPAFAESQNEITRIISDAVNKAIQ